MRSTKEPITNSNQLEQLRDRFELWRREHPGRPRLPQELWSAASDLGEQYGVYRTAKTLRLSYDALRQHIQGGPAGEGKQLRTPRFVEVLPWSPTTMPECSVELENTRGAKIKIQLRGAAMSELTNLTRLFWSQL